MKMKTFFFIILFFFIFISPSGAIYDPLSKPNNIYGIHILSPDEVTSAKNLVNSSNGDWGYVTIPIQISDKNLKKWQKFMNDSKSLHLIPIVRISTTGDYFNTKVWEKPNYSDLLDFANFLNSLSWPIKNRYIVIFNEPNRGDEWGGIPNASDYANLLSYAYDIFKANSSDFFVISAGLDNAAPNKTGEYIDEYTFLYQMDEANPGIFNKIDGISSHAYPNPGFSQLPYVLTKQSIESFKYEQKFIESLSGRKLPIFITETGWSSDKIPEAQIANFYKYSFENVWNDEDIVAVTPFLLQAGSPFAQFSFINNGETPKYKEIQNIKKVKGIPEISDGEKTSSQIIKNASSPIKDFSKENYAGFSQKINVFKTFLKWFLSF